MSVKDLFRKFSEPEDIDDREDMYDSYDGDDRDDDDDGYRDPRDRRGNRNNDYDYPEDRRPESGKSRRAGDDDYNDGWRRASDRPHYDRDEYRDDRRASDRPHYNPDEYGDDDRQMAYYGAGGDDYYPGSEELRKARKPVPPDDFQTVNEYRDSDVRKPDAGRTDDQTQAAVPADPEPACFMPGSYYKVREHVVPCLREEQIVLIDVSDMPQVDIGRTIDFLMGVTLAMNAKLFRLSRLNVLAVVPEGVPADNDALSKTILAYKASLPQTTGAAEDADGSADSADSQ